MKLTRWSPLSGLMSPLQQFQTEMNRLFDRWGEESNRLYGMGGYPAVNVWEDEDNLFLEAELPGVEFKDVEVLVTGGTELTVKVDRKPHAPEQGVWHRQERAFGTFTRSLSLPFAVDPDRVEARLENGVLTVKLAKHESARPRKIAVKSE